MIPLVKLSPSSELADVHRHTPPMGLMYVGRALTQAGYEVRIDHLATTDVDSYVRTLETEEVLFAGFSVFTGSAIKAAADLARKLKQKRPDLPVVWGGVHPSCLPHQCLQEAYIDFVCIGEGEETAVELARALEGKRPVASVRGIGYLDGAGRTVINPQRPFIRDLDRFPIDWSLVDPARYIVPFDRYQRTINIVSSRGCPHNCAFCYNSAIHKRRWRAHSVDHVVSEIHALARSHDIDAVRFRDDNFFVDRDRAFEILERLDMPFSAAARVDYIDEDLVRRLNRTRCFQLFLGFESGSDRVLKDLLNKDITVEQNLAAMRLLRMTGSTFRVIGGFIFASPTETREEFLESIRLIPRLLDIYPNMSFSAGHYLPYPGTPLYELAVEKGFQPPGRTEDWELLDRLAGNLPLTWTDWFSSALSAQWGRYITACAFASRNHLHPMNRILKWRLRRQVLAFPLDVLCATALYKAVYRASRSPWMSSVKSILSS